MACLGSETCQTFRKNYEDEWNRLNSNYNFAFGRYDRTNNRCFIHYFDKHWESIVQTSDIEKVESTNLGLRLSMIFKRN